MWLISLTAQLCLPLSFTQPIYIDASASGTHGSSSEHMHSKYLHHQVPLEKQGCIPFLGLFVFDLTHIAVSPPWYYPVCMSSSSSMSDGSDGANGDGSLESNGQNSGPQTPLRAGTGHTTNPTLQLQAPHPKDLQELLPSGELLVHFHRYQLIGKRTLFFPSISFFHDFEEMLLSEISSANCCDIHSHSTLFIIIQQQPRQSNGLWRFSDDRKSTRSRWTIPFTQNAFCSAC